MANPSGGQFFLYAVLAQTRRQPAEVNLIKRLILIEAGKYISNLACRRIFMRLKTLSADLFHHALHRRIDRTNREVIRLEIRLKLVMAGSSHRRHHAVGADRNDTVGISQSNLLGP